MLAQVYNVNISSCLMSAHVDCVIFSTLNFKTKYYEEQQIYLYGNKCKTFCVITEQFFIMG